MRLILFIFIAGIIGIISLPILILFFIVLGYKNNNKGSVSDNQIEIEKQKYNAAQGYYRNQRIKQKENQNQKQVQSEKKHAYTQQQNQSQNHNPNQGQDLSQYYAFIEWLKQLQNHNKNQSQNQSQKYEERKKPKEAHYCPYTPEEEPEVAVRDEEGSINYKDGYKAKKLLSKHETDAYDIIKQVADEKGYTVFTKVRLLDLVEPKETKDDSKAHLWKIQAKHVDFVVCDKELAAKWVIELQDKSHKRPDRANRDIVVKSILTACGYKILMTYNVTPEKINYFLSE